MGKDQADFIPGSLVPDQSRVLVANGMILHAKAKGLVHLPIGQDKDLKLEALFVPDLSHNLISVRYLQFTQKISTLLYGDEHQSCCQLLQNNRVLCTAPFINGLWILGRKMTEPIPIPEPSTPEVQIPNLILPETCFAAVTLQTLHHKLGHASASKILHMIKHNHLEGVNLVGPYTLDNCYGCAMGKQHREPLVSDDDKPATRKLDLVHMDLMGPFLRPTRGGHNYVLTIIDDYSKFVWAFFLKKKSDAFGDYTKWAAKVERESGCTISRFRTDQGGEFQNKLMTAFCLDHHYTQEFSNAYTPQQNGSAERFNRTCMETVRCLLAAANMSSLWWGNH
jgi:hypothetical protein